MRHWILSFTVVIALVVIGGASAQTYDNTSTFTYQGYLEVDNTPVNSTCDFEFALYDALSAGTQIGSLQTATGVIVEEGVFAADLNFGSETFANGDRYLEIAVDCGSGIQGLKPRQPITPAPVAMALPALRTDPDALDGGGSLSSPNIIGGNRLNTIAPGAIGAVIAGGGVDDNPNQVGGDYGVVSGGEGNLANGTGDTVGGGRDNIASGLLSTVGGGSNNEATEFLSTVGGGDNNTANGNRSVVAGGGYNDARATYSTIAGGGPADRGDRDNTNNRVYDEYGTIGGGGYNRVGSNDTDPDNSSFSTISGGKQNTASGNISTVSGGEQNTASSTYTTVGGGFNNTASGTQSVISGGRDNTASGGWSVIGGGTGNTASGISNQSAVTTVSGGRGNTASSEGSTVSGGQSNTASGEYSTVGGGIGNDAIGERSTVGGGFNNYTTAAYATIAGGGPADTTDLSSNINTQNRVYDDYGTIGGGGYNRVGTSDGSTTNNTFATVGGGRQNKAAGEWSTVPGGYGNDAFGVGSISAGGRGNDTGGDYSFVAGFDANLGSSADHTFLWSDGSFTGEFGLSNRFNVIATDGVHLYTSVTNGQLATGARLEGGSGTWSSVSDRNAKENLQDVNPDAVLQAVVDMPITTWNYIAQGDDVRHIGPMAQDFYAAFGLGTDDTHITTIDADGVALAAIQGLYERVQSQEERIAELEADNADLSDLQERIEALENQASGADTSGTPWLLLILVGAGGFWLARRTSAH